MRRRTRPEPILPVSMNSSSASYSSPSRSANFNAVRRNRNRQSSLGKTFAIIISLSSLFSIIVWMYPKNNHARDTINPYDTQFKQQRDRAEIFHNARREREEKRARREREQQSIREEQYAKLEELHKKDASYRNDRRKDQQRRQDRNNRKKKREYRQNIPGDRDRIVGINDIFSKEEVPTPSPTIKPTPSPTSKPTLSPTSKPTLSPTSKAAPTPQLTNNEIKESGDTITCPDQTTVGVLNDDYCDCPDGSDEPNTSACSNILVQKLSFHCLDGELQIHASRVNDGINDCPDGSDESLKNVVIS